MQQAWKAALLQPAAGAAHADAASQALLGSLVAAVEEEDVYADLQEEVTAVLSALQSCS